VCASASACATTCGNDGECTRGFACLGRLCRTNAAPVAVAGAAQEVDEGSEVTLDGRGSIDADGDSLVFRWHQASGAAAILDDAGSNTPRFAAPAVFERSDLVFELVVGDGFVESAPAFTVVTVRNTVNEPPVAQAGPDQEVASGDIVLLDGQASSDPNGDPLDYRWSQETGPTPVVLSDPLSATPRFVAPSDAHDAEFSFKLVVNDGLANSAPDEVRVTVLGAPSPDGGGEEDAGAPEADAGAGPADAGMASDAGVERADSGASSDAGREAPLDAGMPSDGAAPEPHAGGDEPAPPTTGCACGRSVDGAVAAWLIGLAWAWRRGTGRRGLRKNSSCRT